MGTQGYWGYWLGGYRVQHRYEKANPHLYLGNGRGMEYPPGVGVGVLWGVMTP